MTEQPGLTVRLWARVRGEIPADTLEAYRRAGTAVVQLTERVDLHRLEHQANGGTPWSVEGGHQAMLLAGWNAFFLQTMGDNLLSADYDADPKTLGYVPKITAEQALAFYNPVETWVSRARQAETNPTYALDCALPDELPRWVEVEPCPRAHLAAMLATAKTARLHTEAASQVFEEQTTRDTHTSEVTQFRQHLSEANSAAEYAEGFLGGTMTPAIHETLERHLKDALEHYYRLGQLLAMPSLLDAEQLASSMTNASSSGTATALPGTPGFDQWILTDPRTVSHWKADEQARKAIASLWNNDPQPSKTLVIQEEIQTALSNGDIQPAGIGNYFCCPWSPIYTVKRPVTIANAHLQPRHQFTFDVSAEELAEGGEFKREILVANFQPSSSIDYCLPEATGD